MITINRSKQKYIEDQGGKVKMGNSRKIVTTGICALMILTLVACNSSQSNSSKSSSSLKPDNKNSSTTTSSYASSANGSSDVISYVESTIIHQEPVIIKKQETVWDRVEVPASGKVTAYFDKLLGYSYAGQIPKSTKYGMGFYHLFPGGNFGKYTDAVNKAYGEYAKSDLVNTFLGNLENMNQLMLMLKDAKQYNNQVFGFAHTFFSGNTDSDGIDRNFKTRMDAYVKTIKDAGYYEQFAGFYFDEPINSCTEAGMLKLSKYNHDTYGKKFFVMLTPLEFDGITSPSSPKDPNPAYFTYITDTGFSDYGNMQDRIDEYQAKVDRMHSYVDASGSNARIWHVGCTERFALKMNEDDIIYHTMVMMDFLSREKNPGGFLGYTYSGGSESEAQQALVNILNPAGDFAYTRLKSRLDVIGRYVVHEGIDRFKKENNIK